MCRAMTAGEHSQGERIARAAVDAFNRGDADAFAALVHPDFEFRPLLTRSASGEPYRGPEGARQYVRDSRAWARTRLVLHEIGDYGDVIVTRGELSLEANGRRAQVPAVYVTRLRDGLVTEVATLADVAGAAAALAVPNPEETAPPLDLRVDAKAEHIPALRSAARAFAAVNGVDSDAVALAVSEAATNAVLHAYVDAPAPGPVELTGRPTDDGIAVCVADRGSGLRPRHDSPGLGLGLSLMQRMAAEVTFVGVPDRETGTEVRLRFRRAA